MDTTSEYVFYEKDIHKKMPMASTTKIMTVILTIESGDLEREITFTKDMIAEGSNMGLKVGDKVYIGFNENNRDQPIILGVLPTQKHTSFPSTTLDSLVVNNDTKLSSTTEIGKVKSKEIQYLEGLSSNAQGQLNRLEEMCNNIVKISVQGNSLVITDIKETIN